MTGHILIMLGHLAERKARTGELTPPGISFWAALKRSWERVVLCTGAETGAEGEADKTESADSGL